MVSNVAITYGVCIDQAWRDADVPTPPEFYDTPFKRHLAFFDRNNDGFIYASESLMGSLALGLNFPAALAMSVGFQVLYGNTGSFLLGPFRGIDIKNVKSERYMLQGFPNSTEPKQLLGRKEISAAASDRNLVDRLHVIGLWALAANQTGTVSRQDVKLCQDGMLLPELEKRRKDKSDVIPFVRGGPLSVAGHSWVVDKLFGVKVYQDEASGRKRT